MAETITGSKPLAGSVPDPAAANAEIAAKLAAQGRETASPKVEELVSTGDALDELAKAKEAPKVEPADGVTPPEPTAEELAASAKAEADKKAADEKNAAVKSRADELFKDTPSLPQGAAPRSTEAFAAIKHKAVQDILALEEKLKERDKQIAEYAEKLKTPVPEQITKELEAHRQWRAKMDVDFDPAFKQFDKKIAENAEFIYDQLRQAPGVTEDVINEIKKYGGPHKVKLNEIFETIQDPTMQKIVEAKVADIAHVDYQKRQAINAAKSNVTQYLKEREKEFSATVNNHTEETTNQLNSRFLPTLEWFKDQEVTGDDAAKAKAADFNKFLANTRQEIQEALGNDTPEMRAILITGYAQLVKFKRDNAELTAKADTLEKANKELTGKLEKIQRATRSRLPESAAPAGGLPAAPVTKTINTDTGGSLDAIAKQVMEARNAAR